MSFYFDNDDDDVGNDAFGSSSSNGGGLSFASQQTSTSLTDDPQQQRFRCHNCNAAISYVDEHGNLCCAACFTQSQTVTQQELDYEDTMELAARGRSGRWIGVRQQGAGKSGKAKQPLQNFDRSVALPSLQACLLGFQIVLRQCCVAVCELLGCDASVQATVQDMLTCYLRSYADAAETYGKLHPPMRFSLRDAFLPPVVITRILANLSYKAQTQLKQEVKDSVKDSAKNGSAAASAQERLPPISEVSVGVDEHAGSDGDDDAAAEEDEEADHTNGDANDGDMIASNATAKRGRKRKATAGGVAIHPKRGRNASRRADILRMLRRHFVRGAPVGKMEAALLTQPSMTMIAAMLLVAAAPIGLTDFLLVHWIENGALPLSNAFPMLPEEQRKKLHHVKAFFRSTTKTLNVKSINRAALGLQVACGFRMETKEEDGNTSARSESRTAESRNSAEDDAGAKAAAATTNNGGDGDDESENTQPGTTSKPRKRRKTATKPSTNKKRKRESNARVATQPHLYTMELMPIITSRLITLCGFSVHVLCYTLSLMDINIYKTDLLDGVIVHADDIPKELPKALDAARQDTMWSKSHLGGVVVVACKMVGYGNIYESRSDREKRQRRRREQQQQQRLLSQEFALHQNSQDSSNSDQPSATTVDALQANHQTTVPWNDRDFDRITKNGPTLQSYLDFQERVIMSDIRDSTPTSEFMRLLFEEEHPETRNDDDDDSGGDRIVPDVAATPKDNDKIYVLHKSSDARNHAMRPGCPVTGLLIEIVSHYIREEPSEIARHVKALEAEIVNKYHAPTLAVKIQPLHLYDILMTREGVVQFESTCLRCLRYSGQRNTTCVGRLGNSARCEVYESNGTRKPRHEEADDASDDSNSPSRATAEWSSTHDDDDGGSESASASAT